MQGRTIDREFFEAPSFSIESGSISLLFDISAVPATGKDGVPATIRAGIELQRIMKEIYGSKESERQACASLVDGARSFLDDVTTGDPGDRGRPLFFQASDVPHDHSSRLVTLIRPARWQYDAEGSLTELMSPDLCDREIKVRVQDGFFAFSSGHLFYVLTLSTVGLPQSRLDEYGMLQFEQIAIDPSLGNDVQYLSFRQPEGSARYSVFEFAQQRLQWVDDASDAMNGPRDLIRRFNLRSEAEGKVSIDDSNLLKLCFAIDSRAISETVMEAQKLDFQEAAKRQGDQPESSNDDQPDEEKVHKASVGGALSPQLLALAGMTQGVVDFPFQDPAEVYDATRPVATSGNSALFAHPRFLIEIGSNWRSYRQAQSSLGTCPYLALTWVSSVLDEILLREIEDEVQSLIYGKTEGYRTHPLNDVDKIMQSALGSSASAVKIHTANLKRRLDMFRREINRPENFFRYPKEKHAFKALREAASIESRYERAREKVDRVANLVEQAPTLSQYQQRRVNYILFIFAILGLFSLPSSILQSWTIIRDLIRSLHGG